MGLPVQQEFDVTQYRQDLAAYQYWFSRQFGHDELDEERVRRIDAALRRAMRDELTDVQYAYFSMYYFEGLTMYEIAMQAGVAPSTVSRTLSRARRRVGKALAYADPALARLFDRGPKGHRTNNSSGGMRYKPASG